MKKEKKGFQKHIKNLKWKHFVGFSALGIALGLGIFLVLQNASTKAWVGSPPIFPTINPPINISSDSSISTKPAIASDPDNLQNLFSVWQDGTSQNIFFARSTDGGATWVDKQNISSADTNTPHESPDVAFSQTSKRIHITYQNSVGLAYLYLDTKIAMTPQVTPVPGTISIYTQSNILKPPKVAANNSNVVVMWDYNGNSFRAYSSDEGATGIFSTASYIGQTCPRIGGIVANSSGKFAFSGAAPYEEVGGTTSICGCISTNGGINWTRVLYNIQLPGNVSPNIDIAAPPFLDGDFYTAYEAQIAGKNVIRAIRWNAFGLISGPDTVSDPNQNSYNPAIVSDNNGYVHVAWQSVVDPNWTVTPSYTPTVTQTNTPVPPTLTATPTNTPYQGGPI